MEDNKKTYLPQWITPDVFCGEIKEAVGQNNYVKRVLESEKPIENIFHSDIIADLKNELSEVNVMMQSMNEIITRQQEEMEKLKGYIRELEANQKKEKAHLYQVVLSLKQEWETQK